MESKGIVRRVDELGRIVLPREMRKSLNIRIGTRLEIGIVDGNKFLLSKYSDMASLKEFSDAVANAISVSIEHDILISDMEKVLSSNRKKYLNKDIIIIYSSKRGLILWIMEQIQITITMDIIVRC